MTASYVDIRQWFDEGVARGATHMIVVCDTFGNDNYPIYVVPGQDARTVAVQYDGKEMQKTGEIYCLSMDRDAQLRERMAYHPDLPA